MQGLSQRRQLYERILEIVQKDEAPPHKFLTDKVKTAVKESPLYSSQVRQQFFNTFVHCLHLRLTLAALMYSGRCAE